MGLGFLWEPFLAMRIVRSRSQRRRLSSISAISVTGVVIGVAALTVVSGITGGFQEAFRERILGLYPHLIAMRRGGEFTEYREAVERARLAPHVRGASPATYIDMLAAHGERRTGVSIRGVDPATVGDVSRLSDALVEGAPSALEERLNVAVESASVRVGGATEGTTWTVALVPAADNTPAHPISFRQLPGEPPSLGLAGIRLAHAVRGEGPLYLASFAGPFDVRAVAAEGSLGRQVTLLGPAADVRVERADGTVFAEATMPVEGDVAYLLVAFRDAQGAPALRLVPAQTPADSLPAEQRAAGRAWVRALDLRSEGAPFSISGEPPVPGEAGGAEPVSVAPGALSRWLEVPGRMPRILLGEGLARRLEVELGDMVTLVSPLRGLGGMALGPVGMAPTSARFEVAGWFRSGFWEYDVRLALVDLQASQRFLNRGDSIQWVEVRFDDDYRVKEYASELKRWLQPYGFDDFGRGIGALHDRLDRLLAGDVSGHALARPADGVGWLDNAASVVALVGSRGLDLGYEETFKLVDWEDMNHNLLSALKLQKVVLTIFFLIIIIVAAFNIVGSQVMLMHDKRADIAILKSMGATKGGITRVFLFQGLALSGAGTLLGLFVGLSTAVLLDRFGFPLDPEVYLIDALPVAIHVPEAAGFAALALAFTVATTLYSSRRAGALPPVEGLRRLD